MGPLSFGRGEGEIFLGRDFARQPDYSEDTARKIDAEVNRIVTSAYGRGKRIITEYRAALEEIAKQLLEKESMDGEEIYDVIEKTTGKALPRRSSGKPKPPAPTAPATVAAKPEEGTAGAPGPLVPVPV